MICTGGMIASGLTSQISTRLDRQGRVEVTGDLRVVGTEHVFAAGDVAMALTDDEGHYSLMSYQHAIFMGRFAGHNVAADLLEAPPLEYRQPFYATCLDLGGWGAVYTEAWDRQVLLTHDEGKARKRMINTQWIYPPAANRVDALEAGSPGWRTADSFLVVPTHSVGTIIDSWPTPNPVGAKLARDER